MTEAATQTRRKSTQHHQQRSGSMKMRSTLGVGSLFNDGVGCTTGSVAATSASALAAAIGFATGLGAGAGGATGATGGGRGTGFSGGGTATTGLDGGASGVDWPEGVGVVKKFCNAAKPLLAAPPPVLLPPAFPPAALLEPDPLLGDAPAFPEDGATGSHALTGPVGLCIAACKPAFPVRST